MLKISEVKTTEEFLLLEKDWNNLLSRSSSDTVFLTWEWLFSWWEIYGQKSVLRILLAKDDKGSLVGIAPCMIRHQRLIGFVRLRVIQFIGCHSVASEYLDFICLKGWEEKIANSFFAFFINSRDWDLLFFYRLPETSATIGFLNDDKKNSKLYSLTTRLEDSLYISLPQSWNDYFLTLSQNTRHNIRRYRKRIEETMEGTFTERHSFGDRSMTDMISLHQVRMENIGRLGSFASHQFVRFHQSIAKRFTNQGWLRMFFLEINDKNVAVRYGYNYGSKFYDYSTGFDPEHEKYYVGFVLLGYCIEKCIKEGIKEFDFLGEGSYKERWNVMNRKKRSMVVSCSRHNLNLYRGVEATERLLASQIKNLIPKRFYQKLRNLKQRIMIRFNKPLR